MIDRHESDAEEPAFRRKHVVLCVDDESPVLSALRRLLRREPYELLTTDNPQEALQWIEERDISLVVSDQRMPEMTGTELLDVVRKRSPATGRVILTGYPGSGLVVQGLHQGIQMLISKPWDEEELKRTIRQLLHEKEEREIQPLEERRAGVPERTIRLKCKGRTSRDLLDELATVFRESKAATEHISVVLDDVTLLDDSVTKFFKGLSQHVMKSGLSISLVDPTGCASAFLEMMGGDFPIDIARSTGSRPGAEE